MLRRLLAAVVREPAPLIDLKEDRLLAHFDTSRRVSRPRAFQSKGLGAVPNASPIFHSSKQTTARNTRLRNIGSEIRPGPRWARMSPTSWRARRSCQSLPLEHVERTRLTGSADKTRYYDDLVPNSCILYRARLGFHALPPTRGVYSTALSNIHEGVSTRILLAAAGRAATLTGMVFASGPLLGLAPSTAARGK